MNLADPNAPLPLCTTRELLEWLVDVDIRYAAPELIESGKAAARRLLADPPSTSERAIRRAVLGEAIEELTRHAGDAERTGEVLRRLALPGTDRAVSTLAALADALRLVRLDVERLADAPDEMPF